MSGWKGQVEYNQDRTSHGPDCQNCHGEGRWWNSVYEDYEPCFYVAPAVDDQAVETPPPKAHT